ncbi:MAG: helix-turn-helix transcriptional regulator [Alphaproteobacteria bacterium]|nr:helix-turn-helix transcriptional regulator [Alphaproteobacteria bacterium]
MMTGVDRDLATRLKLERESRGWAIAELAQRSGVSRAMISKVERGEASPTAALLGRLSAAFGLTLSTLLARAESQGARLARAGDQAVWTDPATGYSRRAISPPAGAPLELVDVELPPGARVAYPAGAFAFLHQQIWVQAGTLLFREGVVEHRLAAGDCLQLGPPADCAYENPGPQTCCYLVALVRR